MRDSGGMDNCGISGGSEKRCWVCLEERVNRSPERLDVGKKEAVEDGCKVFCLNMNEAERLLVEMETLLLVEQGTNGAYRRRGGTSKVRGVR